MPFRRVPAKGMKEAALARKPSVGHQRRLALSREIANKASSTFVDHINDEVAIVQDRELNRMRVPGLQCFNAAGHR
jgi:hypothetical protein